MGTARCTPDYRSINRVQLSSVSRLVVNEHGEYQQDADQTAKEAFYAIAKYGEIIGITGK